MTPEQFKTTWSSVEDNLSALKKENLLSLNLSQPTIDFLTISGLPVDAAPFLMFCKDTDDVCLFPLWYILETNCYGRCFDDIIKFIENHTSEALNELNFLKFTAKVLDAIDRLQSSCSKINNTELNEYRRKIRALRKESE